MARKKKIEKGGEDSGQSFESWLGSLVDGGPPTQFPNPSASSNKFWEAYKKDGKTLARPVENKKPIRNITSPEADFYKIAMGMYYGGEGQPQGAVGEHPEDKAAQGEQPTDGKQTEVQQDLFLTPEQQQEMFIDSELQNNFGDILADKDILDPENAVKEIKDFVKTLCDQENTGVVDNTCVSRQLGLKTSLLGKIFNRSEIRKFSFSEKEIKALTRHQSISILKTINKLTLLSKQEKFSDSDLKYIRESFSVVSEGAKTKYKVGQLGSSGFGTGKELDSLRLAFQDKGIEVFRAEKEGVTSIMVFGKDTEAIDSLLVSVLNNMNMGGPKASNDMNRAIDLTIKNIKHLGQEYETALDQSFLSEEDKEILAMIQNNDHFIGENGNVIRPRVASFLVLRMKTIFAAGGGVYADSVINIGAKGGTVDNVLVFTNKDKINSAKRGNMRHMMQKITIRDLLGRTSEIKREAYYTELTKTVCSDPEACPLGILSLDYEVVISDTSLKVTGLSLDNEKTTTKAGQRTNGAAFGKDGEKVYAYYLENSDSSFQFPLRVKREKGNDIDAQEAALKFLDKYFPKKVEDYRKCLAISCQKKMLDDMKLAHMISSISKDPDTTRSLVEEVVRTGGPLTEVTQSLPDKRAIVWDRSKVSEEILKYMKKYEGKSDDNFEVTGEKRYGAYAIKLVLKNKTVKIDGKDIPLEIMISVQEDDGKSRFEVIFGNSCPSYGKFTDVK